jgi:hypothetical protein
MTTDKSPVPAGHNEEEVIEPELINPAHGYGGGSTGPRPEEVVPGRLKSLIIRIKIFVSAVLFLVALGLLMAGALLTSTVIGAILGIPLILAGIALFWLLFKIITLTGSGNFVVMGNGRPGAGFRRG